MKTNTKTFTVSEDTQLLQFLIETLSNRGRNAVKSILARGQVTIDDHVVTAYNYPLKKGQTVNLTFGTITTPASLKGLTILFEDDHLIIVVKAAGLLSIAADDSFELTAYNQLMEHVRRTTPKNRVFVIHRLDRDTSGVMMFAKTEQAKYIMQNEWQDRLSERVYVALVEGKVAEKKGRIESWLKETNALKMYSSSKPNGGLHAITHYEVLHSEHEVSLLQVQLETGRKNQIRVHMKDIGHPIVGDFKYGAKKNPIGRLGLHANVLEFRHPITNKTMRFEAEIPASFLRAFQKNKNK